MSASQIVVYLVLVVQILPAFPSVKHRHLVKRSVETRTQFIVGSKNDTVLKSRVCAMEKQLLNDQATTRGDCPKLTPEEISKIVSETLEKTLNGNTNSNTSNSNGTGTLTSEGKAVTSGEEAGKNTSKNTSNSTETGALTSEGKQVTGEEVGNNTVNKTETQEKANSTQYNPGLNTTALNKTASEGNSSLLTNNTAKPTLSPESLSNIVNSTLLNMSDDTRRYKDDEDTSGEGSGQTTDKCKECEGCFECPACLPCFMSVPTPLHILHVHVHDRNPCHHGGRVNEFPAGVVTCMCPTGYRGKTCEELTYCHSHPCLNNGTCIDSIHGYKCVCPQGSKGYTCDVVDFCDPNPCEHDAVCVEKHNSYQCVCRHGYKGKQCREVDLCFANPCHNGGSCTDVNGKANCTCQGRYNGDYCQVEKICYENPCKNGATCHESPTKPCSCNEGFTGRFCSDHVCHNNPCYNGGACEVVQADDGGESQWTYKCNCPMYFRGKNCEVPNFCAKNPCKNEGTCVEQYEPSTAVKRWLNVHKALFKCICPPGYKGQQCETNICNFCDEHAECVRHRCVCASGYTGDGYDCTKIPSPCRPNPCKNGATCVIGPDLSYDCACPKGYCGEHCDVICDMCALKPCKNGGKCYAKEEDRYCVCPPQYTGPDCNILIPDLCTPNPCLHNATCTSQRERNEYICNCPGKYVGKNCQTCDCLKAQSIAGKQTVDAFCDLYGECTCPELADAPAMTYNTIDGCVIGETTRACVPNPCLNGGTCTVKRIGEEVCECPSPYYGDRCQYVFCKLYSPCQNGGLCIDVGVRDYKCRCSPQFTGVNCTVPTIEPITETLCNPSPCLYGGTCKELGNGYDCLCFVRYTGPNCEVDRCADCDTNADCIDGHCRCRYGYIGTGYVCERDDEPTDCGVCPADNQCTSGQCVCIPGTTCVSG